MTERTWRVAPIVPGKKTPIDDTESNWGPVQSISHQFVVARLDDPREFRRLEIGVSAGAIPIIPPEIPGSPFASTPLYQTCRAALAGTARVENIEFTPSSAQELAALVAAASAQEEGALPAETPRHPRVHSSQRA